MLIDLKTICGYCLNIRGVSGSYPFGEGALVIKVLVKMFALGIEDSNPLVIKLKCDPEDAQALRIQHKSITPAYHMNKTIGLVFTWMAACYQNWSVN